MFQNKNFILQMFSKITTFVLSFIFVLGLCFSFSTQILAQSSLIASKTDPKSVATTFRVSLDSAKPVDLCSGFIEGACLEGTDKYASGDGKTTITNLTTNVVGLMIFIAAAIAVFFIVLGGYKVMTSNGDEKTAQEGRGMVFNSIIGLVIVMLSYTIITITTGIVANLDIGGK